MYITIKLKKERVINIILKVLKHATSYHYLQQKRAFSHMKDECHNVIAKAKAMLEGLPLAEKTEAELVVACEEPSK